ncbi:chitinase [Luteibacter rhizovicinus]|uniref:chitinase n=1 Tax=Luteibacter rhizovicinus TaxID=242606 RepID=A0A4R3YNA6_9GAMM|nr:glycoside hydrolase family 18 protein [Luteibacter rhizovicinus]TCV93820.1 chitinase [Luteibacter rhizovicinus]
MRRRWIYLRIVALSLVAVLLAACASAPPQPAASYRIVGYIARFDGLETLDVSHIDTLIFAFAKVQDGAVTLDDAARANLAKVVTLKRRQPRLGVVVSVGGWTAGGFSEAAMTPATRQRFADSAAALIVANGADGLDVDWEYPGHNEGGIASSPLDRPNFTELLRAVRSSLDRAGGGKHYTLSIAAADGPFVDGIDIAAVNPLLDWFNLMTYDFHNSMTPTSGHHSGLHASALAAADSRTTDRAVRQFEAAGVPARKLFVGAAFYGREFADVRDAHNGLYQTYGHYQGEHDWPELKRDFIGRNGYIRYWDAEAKAPYLWNPTTHRFVSYDDPESLAAKAAYVKAEKLGGVMYWEQSHDEHGELVDAIWNGLK